MWVDSLLAMAVEAVIFDWGGTLTPWHTIDLREQWMAYTCVYDPLRADELAGALLAAEADSWAAARDHHRSATLDEVFRAADIQPSGEAHVTALAACERGWEPHTWTDPAVAQREDPEDGVIECPIVMTGDRDEDAAPPPLPPPGGRRKP